MLAFHKLYFIYILHYCKVYLSFEMIVSTSFAIYPKTL